MNNLDIPYAQYAKRRSALAAKMNALGGGIALIPTAPEQRRNSDSDFPFRADSYFHYLSGFPEPGAMIALIASGATYKSVLFCRAKNPEMEIWDGYRYGPEAAREVFGFDEAYAIEQLDEKLAVLMGNLPTAWWPFSVHAGFESRVQGWLGKARDYAFTQRMKQPIDVPHAQRDICPLLDDMRLIKDAHEIALMRRAAQISAGAHARAMRTSAQMMREGAVMREYHLEAELLYEFRRHGAQSPAYTSIVAAGANCCVLHYCAGNVAFAKDDLCLIDAGCELDGYASDVTRTFPVSGNFSGPQKALYDIVLNAQLKAIEAVQPGAHCKAPHLAALRVLVQGMLDTKLLDPNTVGTDIETILKGDAYRQYYMHGTGHWLGLDVHDCGEYLERDHHHVPMTDEEGKPAPRIFRAGMVTTVEPGIYVRPAPNAPEAFWNIGIRIEDAVLITRDGNEVLSQDAPKTVNEIEALMRG